MNKFSTHTIQKHCMFKQPNQKEFGNYYLNKNNAKFAVFCYLTKNCRSQRYIENIQTVELFVISELNNSCEAVEKGELANVFRR